jgi:dCMP deaminase
MGCIARPSWDETWISVADVMARRSVCFRNKCAAIIVRDGKRVVSTGYNGAPVHQKNCAEIGFCYREKNGIKSGTELERCRACGSHAETNAVAMAARDGTSTNGTTMYITGHDFVCTQCKGTIANAGITRVVLKDRSGTIHEFIPSFDWVVHPVDQL